MSCYENYCRQISSSNGFLLSDYKETKKISNKNKISYPYFCKYKNDKYIILDISYPSTTEVIAEHLANGAEYTTAYNKELGREIIILHKDGIYLHEYTKEESILALYIKTKSDFKLNSTKIVNLKNMEEIKI